MVNESVPFLFSISMFPTDLLGQEENLVQLLNIFESNNKFMPTEWGDVETIKVDYDRSEIIERVKAQKVTELYLHRNKSVKYTGIFDIFLNPRTNLNVDFHKSMPKKLWPIFFELSDRIAEIVKPRYGVTHIYWPEPYPWSTDWERIHAWMNLSTQVFPTKFLPNGPTGVGMRTYFGDHIIEMFGRDFLKNTPAIVTELEWGEFVLILWRSRGKLI